MLRYLYIWTTGNDPAFVALLSLNKVVIMTLLIIILRKSAVPSNQHHQLQEHFRGQSDAAFLSTSALDDTG